MDHILHLVCIAGVIFGTPYTCVVYGIRQCIVHQIASCGTEQFFANILLIFSCDLELKFTLPNIQM